MATMAKRKATSGKTETAPTMAEILRSGILADERTVNAICVDAGIRSPINLWRFLRDERTLKLPAVEKLCGVLGLELRKRGK